MVFQTINLADACKPKVSTSALRLDNAYRDAYMRYHKQTMIKTRRNGTNEH